MRDPDTVSSAIDAATPDGAETRRLRLCVIFNPNAGLSRRRLFQRTLTELDALGCDVRVHATQDAGDAERLARDPPPCDRLVVAGGDGTMHEVLNGLGGRHVPVALIPLGTANVLAREIGLRRHPRAIARTVVHGALQPIQLGEVNERLFFQMTGVGFDARVVARVSRRLKQRVGQWAFVWAFCQVALRYGRPRYEITLDGDRTASAPFMVLTNGRYYGGAFMLAPQARLTDPGLHACLFTNGGLLRAIRYGLALIANQLPRLSDVRVEPASLMTVSGPDGDPIQADGEVVGRLPAAVRTLPEAATLVVPREPPAAP